MSIFAQDQEEHSISRSTILKIESFEENGVIQIFDEMEVDAKPFSDIEDVKILIERRRGKCGGSEQELDYSVEMDISKEQAISLAKYLLSSLT